MTGNMLGEVGKMRRMGDSDGANRDEYRGRWLAPLEKFFISGRRCGQLYNIPPSGASTPLILAWFLHGASILL